MNDTKVIAHIDSRHLAPSWWYNNRPESDDGAAKALRASLIQQGIITSKSQWEPLYLSPTKVEALKSWLIKNGFLTQNFESDEEYYSEPVSGLEGEV